MPEKLYTALPSNADADTKALHYVEILSDLKSALQDESNWVAAMATVSSVLHHAFDYFHWTGFYCAWPNEAANTLIIGPYQGSLGCLRIPFGKGVCGIAASSRQTQLVPDVHAFPGHIACASSTQSEIVVPVISPSDGEVIAVLDVDSDEPAAFDEVDKAKLEELCSWLASRYRS